MSEKISVIFPVFGNFDRRRLFLAVESVRLQNYSNVEIVIAEHNSKPTYRTRAKKQGAKYVYKSARRGHQVYNVGYVRNLGIKHSTGKYLYLNDADIVFLRKSYLKNLYRLLLTRKPTYFVFPPVKRLIRAHFDDFYARVLKNGLRVEISKLSFPDGYTTNTDKRNPLKVVRYGYYRKKYTLPLREFKKISASSLEKYGYGLLHPTYHAGGTFVERKKIIAVGGYCQDFRGWGLDDPDLQAKLYGLSKREGTRRMSISKKRSFEVMHLDHKMHFDKNKYEANTRIFEKRQELKFEALVRLDKKRNGL